MSISCPSIRINHLFMEWTGRFGPHGRKSSALIIWYKVLICKEFGIQGFGAGVLQNFICFYDYSSYVVPFKALSPHPNRVCLKPISAVCTHLP